MWGNGELVSDAIHLTAGWGTKRGSGSVSVGRDWTNKTPAGSAVGGASGLMNQRPEGLTRSFHHQGQQHHWRGVSRSSQEILRIPLKVDIARPSRRMGLTHHTTRHVRREGVGLFSGATEKELGGTQAHTVKLSKTQHTTRVYQRQFQNQDGRGEVQRAWDYFLRLRH